MNIISEIYIQSLINDILSKDLIINTNFDYFVIDFTAKNINDKVIIRTLDKHINHNTRYILFISKRNHFLEPYFYNHNVACLIYAEHLKYKADIQKEKITKALRGLITLSPTKLYCFRKSNVKSSTYLSNLSLTEKKVFSELLLGHSNKEISFNMNISINTVKVHIHNIFKKLNIKKRNEILLIQESEINLTIAST